MEPYIINYVDGVHRWDISIYANSVDAATIAANRIDPNWSHIVGPA